MKTDEFSNEFDVLANSYRRFTDFDHTQPADTLDFNEYEKSVFLTSAQEQLTKELYTGSYRGKAFETTEEMRRSLDELVTTKEYTSADSGQTLQDYKYKHQIYNLPDKCMYIVYEQAYQYADDTCTAQIALDVIPVKHDEFIRISRNPFRGPTSKRVLRLDKGDNQVELVSLQPVTLYTIRYIRKPHPIILTQLNKENIDGEKAQRTCELNEVLHREILEIAVRMAVASRIGNSKSSDKSEDE